MESISSLFVMISDGLIHVSFRILADDGALLAKIHKVKVLRNHKREGKLHCCLLDRN